MSYLQDLYQGDRECFAHERRDDRDLAETMRARGYAVQMHEWTYYGRQTDAQLGTCWAIRGVALSEHAIRELQAHDDACPSGEDRTYTFLPHGHMTTDELYAELAPDFGDAALEQMGQDVAAEYVRLHGLPNEEIPF
jgi:hypothetical protein